MKCILIYDQHSPSPASQDLIVAACKKNDLEYQLVDIHTFDESGLAGISNEDILYRIATGNRAREIEKSIIIHAPKITTLYRSNEDCFFSTDPLNLYAFHSLAIPKTVILTHTDEAHLKKAVAAIGSFPLIFKQLGKSHGLGVQRIFTFEELMEKVTEAAKESHRLVLRENIPHKKHARLIVLGDTVIGSISYLAQEGEFRTNFGDPLVQAENFSDAIQDLAIEVVKKSRKEFGGVDILIHEETGDHYLAEFNFPCFFPRVEYATGINIAEQVIQYLQKKSLVS